MFTKSKIRKALPHVIALALFIVISFVYYYPVLEGKVLKTNDSSVAFYNSKEIRDYREKNGDEPLWTNSIFSGMPAYLISTKHPGNLIKQIDLLIRSFKMPVSVLFISMAGFYVLLLMFGLNPWLAMTGALAYGLSSYFFLILGAGHNSKAIAMAYMAPMIGGIYYTYRHDALKGALFTAFALSLEIVAGHPQITYYGLLCVLVFGITELIYSVRNDNLKNFLRRTALLIIPFLLAIGINFSNLYTTYEYGKFSIRGKSDLTQKSSISTSGLDRDYITHWSYGIDETMNLLIPNFKGGGSGPFDRDSETFRVLRQNNATAYSAQLPRYWGTQPMTDGPHYLGAIVIFLFILGIVIVKGPEKWWLVTATAVSVMLAWGKNFMLLSDLFINYFPGYNKFRAVTMILVIAQFCVPLLGMLALRDIFSREMSGKRLINAIRIAAGISGGLALIFLLFPGLAGSFLNQYEAQLPDWLSSAMIADRKDLLKSDSFRSLLFIALAAAVITAFAYQKLRKEYAVALIGIMILLDLWTVDKRYLNAERFERPSVIQKSLTPTKADAMILADQSTYRVLNMSVSTFNDNTPTSYFHKSIGGYHGAKLRRYQELIDSSIMGELMQFRSDAEKATSFEDLRNAFVSSNAINMLNTRYIIINPEAPPVINPYALGNAWFVTKPLSVENADQELSSIRSIDLKSEAVYDKKFANLIPESQYPVGEDDKISLISYQPNELIYKYSAEGERFAVFSEIYYPAGWKSSIDGKEAPHFRANYLLRAMILPEGEHEIRFYFEPASYITGNKISMASSLLLFLITAGYLIALFLKKNKAA